MTQAHDFSIAVLLGSIPGFTIVDLCVHRLRNGIVSGSVHVQCSPADSHPNRVAVAVAVRISRVDSWLSHNARRVNVIKFLLQSTVSVKYFYYHLTSVTPNRFNHGLSSKIYQAYRPPSGKTKRFAAMYQENLAFCLGILNQNQWWHHNDYGSTCNFYFCVWQSSIAISNK